MSVRTSAWPIQQAAAEEHSRTVRCTWMLTRLRKLLWKAAWLEVDNESDVFLEGFIEWGIACLDARYFLAGGAFGRLLELVSLAAMGNFSPMGNLHVKY
jgi:hypothetical protein